MRIPYVKITMKRLLRETEKAFQFKNENGKEIWVPKSLCRLVSPKSAYDKNGDLNTCKFQVVIAPFKFEELTGRIPQSLDTHAAFQRDVLPESKIENVVISKSNYELLDHQEECVKKFMHQNKASLFMDMGTGKTLTALCLAQSWKKSGHVDTIIVVCPVSLKDNWKTKALEYYDQEPDYVFGSESLSHDTAFFKIKNEVQNVEINRCCVIIDESHFFKNHDIKRTERVFELFEQASFKLVLTGTPITQNAADLYTQIGFLSPEILGFESYEEFEKRHLLLDERNKVVGYTGIEEVSLKASPYVYQIKSEECIKLPEKIYKTISFEITPEQKTAYFTIARYAAMEREKGCNEHNVLGMMVLLQMIASGFIPDMDRVISEMRKENWNINDEFISMLGEPIRNNPRVEMLHEILGENQGEQFVIFYRFQHEKRLLEKQLKDAAFLDGKTPVKRRQAIVEQFREQKKRIIVAQIQVGGVGFDLETSSNIVFFTTDWSLANRLQAEARCWRKGQKKQVKIFDLVAENSIEYEILKCLHRKKDIKNAFETELEKVESQECDRDNTVFGLERTDIGMDNANSKVERAY